MNDETLTPENPVAEAAEAAVSETESDKSAAAEAVAATKDAVDVEEVAAEPAAPEDEAAAAEMAAEGAPAGGGSPGGEEEPEKSLGAEPGEIPEGAVADDAPEGEAELDQMKALLEAIIYVTEEPLAASQIAAAMNQPLELVQRLLAELTAEYEKPSRGLTIREVAGGYKMGTKPEHHDGVRGFVKNLKPPLKLSLAALETLAVIAYKQPITGPEILEIRGVQGGGVLKTLLDRKLIATAGRKQVVGKPMLYKTTKEFLLQFGLKGLTELPTLKEFEELKRMALTDDEVEDDGVADAGEAPAESAPEVVDEAPVTPEAEAAAANG